MGQEEEKRSVISSGIPPKEPEQIAPPPQQIQQPQANEKKSFSLWANTKDLATIVPNIVRGLIDTGAIAVKYIAHPSQYVKDRDLFWGEQGGIKNPSGGYGPKPVHGEALSAIWGAMKEPWEGDWYNRLPTLAMDVATAGSLGGKAVSTAGKVARLEKVVRAGEIIEKATSPLTLAGKGVELLKKAPIIKPILESQGEGKWTHDLVRLAATEQSIEEVAKIENRIKALSKNLTPQDRSTLFTKDVISIGDKASLQKLPVSVLDARNALKAIVRNQEQILLEERLLTPAQMERRLGMGVAFARYGKVTKKTVIQAVKEIRTGTIDPIYTPFLKSKKMKDIFSTLTSDLRKLGFVSRLEAAKGGGQMQNLAEVVDRQISAFHDMNWRLRWVKRVIKFLEDKGEIRAVKNISDLRPGEAFLQDGVLERYFKDGLRAQSIAVNHIRKGIDLDVAAKAANGAVLSDPLLRESVAQARHIAVPRYVSTLILSKFKLPSALARVYDSAMGYMSAALTVFSPRYWLGVAAGNGLLGLLDGVMPTDLLRARKLRKVLTAELRSVAQSDLPRWDTNIIQRAAQNLREYSSGLDNMLKQAVATHEVEKTRQKLMKVGQSFFGFSKAAEQFLRETSTSVDEFSNIQRKIQLIEERAALNIPAYVKAVKLRDRIIKRIASLPPEGKGIRQLKLREIYLDSMERTFRADIVDKLKSAGELDKLIPELSKKSKIMDDAIRIANDFTGSYKDLHPVEQAWFRRAIPFYAFTKAMTMLAFRFPYLYPARSFFWNRYSEMMFDKVHDPDMPEWTKDYVPVAALSNGDFIGVRLGSLSPFGGVRVGEFGNIPVPQSFNPLSQNPFVRIGYELMGGIPVWSKKPVDPGTDAVRVDNGEVYQYRDGIWRKKIAQPSVWRSIYFLFPQSQLIESIFQRGKQTDAGWIANPDPIRNPDGSIAYPRELGMALFSIIAPPTHRMNAERLKLGEKNRVNHIEREYFKQSLRERDLLKRSEMMEVIRDWKKYKNPRIE